MAIELKQSLKLSQQLVITPQLQQAIKLLQLSKVELVEMVQNELVENPVLEEAPRAEEEDLPREMAAEVEVPQVIDKSNEIKASESKEFDWENYLETYNSAGSEVRVQRSNEDLPSFENMMSSKETLSEHLEWQLRMVPNLTQDEERIGLGLIGSFDDNGYATVSIAEFAQNNGCSLEEVQDCLELIQEFDPVGVGAKDLCECLCLQTKPYGEDKALLENIINHHLDLLQRKDYDAIARKIKQPIEKTIALCQIIQEMEPKPGRAYGRNEVQYITPDVHVYKIGDEYAVVLNEEGMPRLRVSQFYQKMLKTKALGNGDGKADVAQDYVQDKLKSAIWLIKSIHQRQRTLYRVSKSIVKFQQDFFNEGINFLKPMILKDVAEEIGMHESTVSRATNGKYMHTPQGLFELKFFFNSAISRSTGQDLASETVKEKVKTLIANEDLKHPLSDQDLVALLKQSDINIARRTVAKYREVLGILPSSKRRRLY